MVHQFSVIYLLPTQKSDLLPQFQSKNILGKGFTWPSLDEVAKPGAINWGHGMRSGKNVTSLGSHLDGMAVVTVAQACKCTTVLVK